MRPPRRFGSPDSSARRRERAERYVLRSPREGVGDDPAVGRPGLGGGAPAPTISIVRVSAGNELMPAGAFGRPERGTGLGREGVDRSVEGRGEDDVVRDGGGAGVDAREGVLPEDRAGRGVDGGEAARPAGRGRRGEAGGGAFEAEVDPGDVERRRGPRPSGSGRRRASRGSRRRASAGSGPCSYGCACRSRASRGACRRRRGRRRRNPICRRRSRSRSGRRGRCAVTTIGEILEVVVAQVVRGHLLVPEQLAGGAVERDERVGVEVRPRAAAARSGRPASAGRGRGWRRRGRRGRGSRPPAGTRARRRRSPSGCPRAWRRP